MSKAHDLGQNKILTMMCHGHLTHPYQPPEHSFLQMKHQCNEGASVETYVGLYDACDVAGQAAVDNVLTMGVWRSDVSTSAVGLYSEPKVLRIMRSRSFLKEVKRVSISDFPLATEQHD